MKFLLFATSLILLFASCSEIKSKGPKISETHHVSQVATEIKVESAIQLIFSDKMEKGTIVIEANESIMPYVIVSNDDDDLSVSLNEKYRYENYDVTVTVSNSQYDEITAEDASTVTIEETLAYFPNYEITLKDASSFNGNVQANNQITLKCTNASSFKGDIQADTKVMLECADASSLNISGSTQLCEMKLSDASSMRGTGFVCQQLQVDLSDASSAKISVNESITGKLTDASTLEYQGNATVTVETSDASSVSKL